MKSHHCWPPWKISFVRLFEKSTIDPLEKNLSDAHVGNNNFYNHFRKAVLLPSEKNETTFESLFSPQTMNRNNFEIVPDKVDFPTNTHFFH